MRHGWLAAVSGGVGVWMRNVPMVVMLRGMPAYPDTGSSGLWAVGAVLPQFTCTGNRPLCSAERDGAQILYAIWCVSRIPSSASESRFGVVTASAMACALEVTPNFSIELARRWTCSGGLIVSGCGLSGGVVVCESNCRVSLTHARSSTLALTPALTRLQTRALTHSTDRSPTHPNVAPREVIC